MTENALVVQKRSLPTVADYQMIESIALHAEQSTKLGIRKSAAVIKMVAGHELGFGPIASLQIIYFINEIPSAAPKGIWAKVITHPEFAGWKEERLEQSGKFYGWRITLKRKNGVEATRQFTLDDAARITINAKGDKLIDKDNWKNYPENVCYWRTMGFVEDVVFPDVTLGMVRADELGADIALDGSVIDGQWSSLPEPESQPTPTPAPPQPVTPPVMDPPKPVQPKYPGVHKVTDIFQLLKAAGHDSPSKLITQANGGVGLPGNQEEVNQVMAQLVMDGLIKIEAIDPSLSPPPPVPNPPVQADSAAPQTLAELIELVGGDPSVIAQHNGGNYPEDTPGEVATMYAKLVNEKVLPATAESVF